MAAQLRGVCGIDAMIPSELSQGMSLTEIKVVSSANERTTGTKRGGVKEFGIYT